MRQTSSGAIPGSHPSDQAPSGLAASRFDPERIPVITLWQPWASLIFSGHKTYETRGFRPPDKYLGKRIAIHAAAALPASKHFSTELCDLCYDAFGCGWNFSLPRGAILGTVLLGMCTPSEEYEPSEFDRIAGDWSSGRWGWRLWEAKTLSTPLPAKGKQGWWSIPAIAMEAATAGETEGLDPKDRQRGPEGSPKRPPHSTRSQVNAG